ncbi:hypothetical protein B0H14DRAFT_2590953 [Mycena olivaceomarginata]|nr:hypothetical protein B0H14DRAFT_2590953 [Mycena olivaceomarginata]
MPRSEIDRLAHKIGRENTLQRTLHPIAPDTLKSLIHSKSPMFFRDSIFDILNNLNPDDWPALTRLPHLTNLAFNSGNYLEMCLRFLSTREALEALAEDFITKHKSREIDPLKYCIPEPDEDDYGQEDSEDEIDEDDGDDSPSSLFHDAGRLQPHLPSCLPSSSVTSATLSAVSPATCLSSAGTMPFGSQLAVNNEFNFVVRMDFGLTLMALFPSSTSTSTSQLGLSTDELTNDGVTVRINTSNREDFAFDGGFDGGSRVAGDPSPLICLQPDGQRTFRTGATDNVFPGAFIPAVARAAPTASAPGAFMSVFSVATNTVMQKRKRAEGDGVEKPARKHHLERAPEAAPPP